jgi:hypothetical protein
LAICDPTGNYFNTVTGAGSHSLSKSCAADVDIVYQMQAMSAGAAYNDWSLVDGRAIQVAGSSFRDDLSVSTPECGGAAVDSNQGSGSQDAWEHGGYFPNLCSNGNSSTSEQGSSLQCTCCVEGKP